MGEGKDTDLADTLAEVGRKVGQAITDALERVRPAVKALGDVANRPEVRTVIERAGEILQRRPCLCFCQRAHPDDRDICETFNAVISGSHVSEFLGEIEIPLCAPCAAARAAREFSRRSH